MDVLVALFGLVGTLAASAAIADWLKRRSRREVIRTDLDVSQKLPDGPVKDQLMSRIEQRVHRGLVAHSPTGRMLDQRPADRERPVHTGSGPHRPW